MRNQHKLLLAMHSFTQGELYGLSPILAVLCLMFSLVYLSAWPPKFVLGRLNHRSE